MLRRGAATLERLASSPMIDRLTRFFLPFFSNPSSQTLLAERKTISQNFVSLKTNALLLGAGDTHPAETKYHHSSRQKLDCCSSPSSATADWVLVVWPNFCNEAQKIPTKKPRKGDAKTKPEESSSREENFGMPWILVKKHSALAKFCRVRNSHYSSVSSIAFQLFIWRSKLQ